MTVWPNSTKTKPYTTSPFGPRKAPKPGASTFHRGFDCVGFTWICAIEAGVVVAVGEVRGWLAGGVMVWIQHDGFFTRSLHMKAGSTIVKVGDRVVEGQRVGVLGQTGTATDDHLHFEVTPGQWNYSNLGQVDPVAFISNRIASPAGGGGNAGPNPGPEIDTRPARRRREEDGMYIKGASFADVYAVDAVWSQQYPNGQARMRLCGASEAAFATTGGLVVEGFDTVLMQLASDAAYGLPLPTEPREGAEVIMIQDGQSLTYALWGVGFWDDTEGLSREEAMKVANAWARLYGNAQNLTYAEWADRKRVGTAKAA